MFRSLLLITIASSFLDMRLITSIVAELVFVTPLTTITVCAVTIYCRLFTVVVTLYANQYLRHY